MRDHDPFYFNQFSGFCILPNFEEIYVENNPLSKDLFAIYQIKHENIFKSFGTLNVGIIAIWHIKFCWQLHSILNEKNEGNKSY